MTFLCCCFGIDVDIEKLMVEMLLVEVLMVEMLVVVVDWIFASVWGILWLIVDLYLDRSQVLDSIAFFHFPPGFLWLWRS